MEPEAVGSASRADTRGAASEQETARVGAGPAAERPRYTPTTGGRRSIWADATWGDGPGDAAAVQQEAITSDAQTQQQVGGATAEQSAANVESTDSASR
eukprot:12680786-Alexandrium_andersonii.AAC.1